MLIRDTRLFDALVGYFYTSGFYALYKALENTEKIRILIGIGTSPHTLALIHQSESPAQELFNSPIVKPKRSCPTRSLRRWRSPKTTAPLKRA